MKRAFAFRCIFVAILCVFAGISAKAQAPTGTINGGVTDPGGAVVTGANVTATNQTTTVPRTTVTNSDGLYNFPDLPAGMYTVTIKATGFAETEFKDVQLLVGRVVTVDAQLKVASANASVTVGDAIDTVDLTTNTIQGQVTSTTIQSIPLNGRNFLELAYLVPGNRPAPNFDPTKTNTLEVSSDGSVGRGGNITVDGGDNNDDVVGGTLSNFPQDSIAEFQIATAQFSAEAGRSGTSIINILTKSGTNGFHGSLFDYERNRHLDAQPGTLSAGQPKAPFDREQFGGSLGGPFKANKAWWFGSAEYRNQNGAVETAERDFTTDSILNTFAPAPLRDALVSSRVDFQLTPHDTLMGRYSFNRSTDTAGASPASATPFISDTERQNSLNRFNTAVAGWTRTISSNKVNNLLFTFNTFLNSIPEFPDSSPTTNPPGLAATNELLFPDLADGVNFNVPQSTHLNQAELQDTFTWSLGKHTLHLGGQYEYSRAFGEINVFGSGSVILTSDFGFANLSGTDGPGGPTDLDIPIAVAIQSAAPVQPVPIPKISNSYISFFAQDDWRVTRKLTLNLGLRWDFDTDATGTSGAYGPCPNLTEQPTNPCVWMANVIDLHHHPDKKDFGPRIGFAYDPFGQGKTVIRGGYGIFYDRIVFEVPGYERVQDDRALTINQYAGSSCTFPGDPAPPDLNTCFAPIPGVQFAPGSPTLANPFSGPRQPGGVGIIVVDKNTHHPMFQQWSIGFQQQLGSDWTLSADGLYLFGQRMLMAQYLRSAGGSTSPYIACPGSNIPCTVTDPLTGISDQVTVATSNGHSWYTGLLVNLQHRPVKLGKFTYLFNASYTLSKTLDYSDDDQVPSYTTVENVNLIEGTVGPQTEKGYAASDERHRLTAYGQIQMPWGMSLSPLYTFGSGVPADPILPDLNLNGQSLPARLPILGRNSLGRSVKNSNQLNTIINEWNALPACPAPAPCNAGGPLQDVPSNINFSSPFNSLDLRFMKDFAFAERYHLQLIAESFNLFNSLNVRGFYNTSYSGRNTSLLPQGTNPGNTDTGFWQPANTAGGFFSTGGPRAFQFAIRFTF
jgi:hypothetical protein